MGAYSVRRGPQEIRTPYSVVDPSRMRAQVDDSNTLPYIVPSGFRLFTFPSRQPAPCLCQDTFLRVALRRPNASCLGKDPRWSWPASGFLSPLNSNEAHTSRAGDGVPRSQGHRLVRSSNTALLHSEICSITVRISYGHSTIRRDTQRPSTV